jgi:prepilin-type N-terminal cleavage/methylation domain-containing protein
MSKLLKSKKGSTLIEVIIAVMLLAIVASAVLSAITTAHRITMQNEDPYMTNASSRKSYENAVSEMDSKLNESATTSDKTVDITVNFPSGTYTIDDAKKLYHSTVKDISVYKIN